MNLKSQTAFADLANVHKSSITRAIKKGDLELYAATKKIDADSPLSRAYLENPSHQRQTHVSVAQGIIKRNGDREPSEELEHATVKAIQAGEKKAIEEAELKKQQRIEKELKNATRRSELLEAELVETYIMLFLDKVLNNLKRVGGNFFTEIQREILLKGESSPEFKRQWTNEIENQIHDAKIKVVGILKEIAERQAKG